MILNKYITLIKYSFFLSLIIGCANSSKVETGEVSDTVFISYKNPNIIYEGRVDSTRVAGVDMFWSGTSIKIFFEGTSVQATLLDENADNYFDVVIDEDSTFILETSHGKKLYLLAEGLDEGKHSVELFKRTEWDRGRCTFFGFHFSPGAHVLDKSSPKTRKIEFYGNSITAAYGVDDLSGKDSPDSIFTNNHKSYACLTAKHFNAAYSCICKSGIGITVSWMPIIMPEIYDRLDPRDETSKWDFSKFVPEVVVVNLFQNDSWLVERPEHEQFQKRFGTQAPSELDIITAYKEFITSIREKYPSANIVCALGNMDITKEGSPWPGYVKTAVEELNDPRVLTHFMPYKNSPGHPSEEEQKMMANSLIKFIETNIQW